MICKSNGAVTLKQTLVNSSAESGFLQPWKTRAFFFFFSWCLGNASFFDTLSFSRSVMSFPNTLIILSLGARWVYLEVPKPPAKCSQQASLSRAESRRPSPLKRFPLVGWHLLFVFNSFHPTSHGKPLGLPKVSSREQQGGGAGFAHWFRDTGFFFF